MTRGKWISVLKGSVIAAVGAILAYLSQWASGADLGDFGPTIAAIFAVVANGFRKAFIG